MIAAMWVCWNYMMSQILRILGWFHSQVLETLGPGICYKWQLEYLQVRWYNASQKHESTLLLDLKKIHPLPHLCTKSNLFYYNLGKENTLRLLKNLGNQKIGPFLKEK